MKRILLAAAAVSFAIAGMAQQVKPVQMSQAEKLPLRDLQAQVAQNTIGRKAPARRTAATSLYYVQPEGTLFGGWDPKEGWGYYNTSLIVPPFTKLTFTNMSKATEWLFGGEAAKAEDVVDDNYVVSTLYRGYGQGLNYMPTLKGRTGDTYTLGEVNWIKKNGYMTSEYQDGFLRTDSITGMWPSDPRAAVEYNGNWYSPTQSWGVLSTDNLFGSGTYDNNGTEIVASGALQYFSKPASPLYVEAIYVNALTSAGSQPIPTGQQLKIQIIGMKTMEDEEGTFQTYDLDNVIATMYCNSGDTIDFSGSDAGTRNGKNIYRGQLIFTVPGEEDFFGNVTPKNIVIDEPFAVLITGFDQEGVDCGLLGNEVLEEDIYATNARLFFGQPDENGRYLGLSYNGVITLDLCLFGMFDKIESVENIPFFSFEDENLNYNVVRVPVEGSSEEWPFGNMTDGATECPLLNEEGTGTGYPGVPVLTNVYWFDDEAEDVNYEVIGLPDWITNYTVDSSLFDSYGGLNIVSFVAEPLPEGVAGRYAVVKVVGQEVEMNGETKYSAMSDNILIVQGDVDVDAASVKNVSVAKKSNAVFYNLAGQQVNDSFKGIVIRNGKKMIRK